MIADDVEDARAEMEATLSPRAGIELAARRELTAEERERLCSVSFADPSSIHIATQAHALNYYRGPLKRQVKDKEERAALVAQKFNLAPQAVWANVVLQKDGRVRDLANRLLAQKSENNSDFSEENSDLSRDVPL
jgi:hypothetical protein